jgi:pyruvate,water dikinase
MPGHLVHGLGEQLVSGQTSGLAFCLARPQGKYSGPPELGRFARKLYRLASRLEATLGGPQDIEWAVEGRTLYVLQSRPITTLQGHNPATGEWNDSVTGDYLWSNANVSEAVPDVMTPSSWSLWQIFHVEANPIKIPGRHITCGNIGGRPYMNLSLIASLHRAVGKDFKDELYGQMLGSPPEDLTVPIVPFTALAVIRNVLPGLIRARRHVSRDRKGMHAFVAETPAWCQGMRERIEKAQTGMEMASLWREELKPYFYRSCWLLRGVTLLFSDPATALRRTLAGLVGQADADLLLANLADLASLGPVRGLSQVAHGELSRQDYLERYGHRGPHEMELSLPTPDEDPTWLDRQLAEFDRAPVDVDTLLARQRTEFEAAWARLEAQHPRKAAPIRRRLEQVASAARMREAVRSEVTRITRVIRQFALRAGELTGLGDGIFFLSLDEMLEVLGGDGRATIYIPARREMHARYRALPPYPALISGRFDPFQWAADPDRRSDCFDSHAPSAGAGAETIAGFAGAAGRVEGLVRRLNGAEEGDRLQPGEILVTTTTNVGWTPLFPRAAAIVTDVGAPLSHAAIVARELGIPAVVGCGNATSLLRTGDRVRVDGARGTVELVERACQ